MDCCFFLSSSMAELSSELLHWCGWTGVEHSGAWRQGGSSRHSFKKWPWWPRQTCHSLLPGGGEMVGKSVTNGGETVKEELQYDFGPFSTKCSSLNTVESCKSLLNILCLERDTLASAAIGRKALQWLARKDAASAQTDRAS